MNKNLEKLTKIIQEAVPEILELKFGCKYRCLPNSYEAIITGKTNQYHIEVEGLHSVENISTIENKKLVKILGRDITLVDVLRAIEVKNVSAEKFWAIQTDGEMFSQDTSCGEPNYTEIKWDLSQPLHLQSQETVDFLLSILT